MALKNFVIIFLRPPLQIMFVSGPIQGTVNVQIE